MTLSNPFHTSQMQANNDLDIYHDTAPQGNLDIYHDTAQQDDLDIYHDTAPQDNLDIYHDTGPQTMAERFSDITGLPTLETAYFLEMAGIFCLVFLSYVISRVTFDD